MSRHRKASGSPVVSETAAKSGTAKPLTSGERQAASRFMKDDPRINRKGPPKGLVALIKEETGDGEELAMFALRTLRDDSIRFGAELVTPTMRDRQWAVEWLAERAFGKPAAAPEDLEAVKNGLTIVVQSLAKVAPE